jgi:hypothetical protein
MARYIIETKQLDGRRWMAPGKLHMSGEFRNTATSKAAAIELAKLCHAKHHAPKRVIDTRDGLFIFTIGDTPEWEARSRAAEAA